MVALIETEEEEHFLVVKIIHLYIAMATFKVQVEKSNRCLGQESGTQPGYIDILSTYMVVEVKPPRGDNVESQR